MTPAQATRAMCPVRSRIASSPSRQRPSSSQDSRAVEESVARVSSAKRDETPTAQGHSQRESADECGAHEREGPDRLHERDGSEAQRYDVERSCEHDDPHAEQPDGAGERAGGCRVRAMRLGRWILEHRSLPHRAMLQVGADGEAECADGGEGDGCERHDDHRRKRSCARHHPAE
jgi:hypothetical protein